jgi:hypothetical protein
MPCKSTHQSVGIVDRGFTRLSQEGRDPATHDDGDERQGGAVVFTNEGGAMHAVLRSRLAIVAFAAAVTAVAVVGGVAHGAGPATPGNGRGPQAYTIGLFGDMPYNALGRSQYPNLLADVNANDVAFSVFDGDLKAGGDGACTNDLYATAIRNFNTLKRPLVWLPGDNDWTDCWGRYGPGTGGFDPLERLAYERQQFASTDQSLGQQTLTLTRQQRDYPENVRRPELQQ